MSSINLQHEIPKNSQEELQEMVKKLNEWQDEIKPKDEQLKKSSSTLASYNLPPVREKFKITYSSRKKENAPTSVSKSQENAVSSKQLNQEATMKNNSNLSEQHEPSKKERSNLEKEKGNEYFKQGNFEEAAKCYTNSVELDPTNVISFANRAMAMLKLRQFEKAEMDCNEAIRLDPSYAKVFARRGSARKELKRFKEAIEDFQEVLSLEPGNKQAIEELRAIDKISRSLKESSELQRSSNEPQELIKESVTIRKKQEVNSALNPAKESSTLVGITQLLDENRNNPSSPSFSTNTAISNKTITEGMVSTIKQSTAASQERAKSQLSKRTFAIKMEVPKEPPKTSYEFECTWNSLKHELPLLYEYLQIIPAQTLPTLFQNSLNSDILSSFIAVLDKFYSKNGELFSIRDILYNMSLVNRFEMIVMFLSDNEKEVLARLFEQLLPLEQNSDIAKEEIRTLRSKYGIS